MVPAGTARAAHLVTTHVTYNLARMWQNLHIQRVIEADGAAIGVFCQVLK